MRGHAPVLLAVGEAVHRADGVAGELYFDDPIHDVGAGEGREAGVPEHALDAGEGGEGDGCVVEDGEDAQDGEGDADVGYYVCC